MPEKPKQDGLFHVGELLPEILPAGLPKKFVPPTRAQQKLIDAGVEIYQEPDAVERAYLARELVQCTLPHSNPGSLPAWTRRNGNLLLTIQAAWDAKKGVPVGYPYGAIPRLLLFWITTEALKTNSRRLELGQSLAQFMRTIGLDPNTGHGKRSDAKRLREQMRRLFRCRISFSAAIEEPHRQGERWLDMEVAPEGELWWDPKRPEQETLWGSWIELGEKFFHAITAAPVPSDMRALRALKRSPLALDLYVWATHKAMSVKAKNKSQFVPWTGLLAQFGADYKQPRQFKQKAVAALKKIQTVYPGLRLQDVDGGLIVLASSKPAVPYKPSQRSLPGA